MQNRYVADAGDFAKYLLLKMICKNNLKLGVNWCLVENESHNNDGKHISYLEKEKSIFPAADPILFNQLKQIINQSSRNISSIEQSGILPTKTLFFSDFIPLKTERINWHQKSLSVLSNSDIVFYDPDNGLEVKSRSFNSIYAPKYVFFQETRETWQTGKSIVIYQHTNRNGSLQNQVTYRINQLKNQLSISEDKISVVKSGHGTSRFYLIIKQDQHRENIDRNLEDLKDEKIATILEIV